MKEEVIEVDLDTALDGTLEEDIETFTDEDIDEMYDEGNGESEDDYSDVDEEDDEVSEYNDTATQIAEMEAAIEEAANNYRMLFAEYDNYRKRTTREKLETFNDATMKCIERLLPVIDSFERGVESECTDENYKNGMIMIFGQLKSFLEKNKVASVGVAGEVFDPNLHNAVSQVETEDFESGSIAQVYMKGYKVGEKLLRPAMVAVAK